MAALSHFYPRGGGGGAPWCLYLQSFRCGRTLLGNKVEELQAEAQELALRPEGGRGRICRGWRSPGRPSCRRRRNCRPQRPSRIGPAGDAPQTKEASAPHDIGVVMVPPQCEDLVVAVLPDVYGDIVEVIADASGPLQEKQIVPRIDLPTTGRIEGSETTGGTGLAGRGGTWTIPPHLPRARPRWPGRLLCAQDCMGM